MSKLIKVLATSLGSGMLLGFGARALVEAAGQRRRSGDSPSSQPPEQQEKTNPIPRPQSVPSGKRFQEDPLPAFRQHVEKQMLAAIDGSVRAAEQSLHQAADELRADIGSLFATPAAPESPTNERIVHLEAAVSAQSAMLRTLQECSLQTERNMQKLLLSLDRLATAQQPPANHEEGRAK